MSETPRGWYPVALADGLEPGTTAGTRLFGYELVVWRDDSGHAHVWEDRCPHRGMRLSFGFVRGGHLACLYHGWQFDAAGQCRHIPSHPDLRVPTTIHATVFATVERLGMVWTRAGPALPSDGPPGAELPTVPVRSLALRVPAAAALHALADHKLPSPGEVPDDPLLVLRIGDLQVAVAVQPVSDTESTVHLAIIGDPATHRGAPQAQVSLWAEALRRTVEAGR